ncbi:Casparian strip membrane protein [Parasponia andersonii]|uniref:CASP-like protein n=1 Tax=Parasponia andersonii TaxID=3476 RepID=A0A2P5CRG9_PARAD|nr:Casparian strip membrane protein [Parasponia andersonii]
MALANRDKPEDWTLLMLRIASFLVTASATIVMALNKETKTLVVATIGSNPVTATLTAKFQYDPAFVFFVVANGITSLHNLLMIVVDLFRHKFNERGICLVMIPIFDMLIVALAAAGDGAATFIAELGKNGNSHARWNKICDKFGPYCDRGGVALIASFIGLGLLLVITGLSIIKLQTKPKPSNDVSVP